MTKRLTSALLACVLLGSSAAHAQKAPPPVQLSLLGSGGVVSAMQTIVVEYEKATGIKVTVLPSPAIGDNPMAISSRLERGERADLVLTEDAALNKLIQLGEVQREPRVDVGKSFIAMAVRQGEAKPDIGSVDAFRKTLLDARSLAYSNSTSGLYLSHLLFPRMKLAEQLRDKSSLVDSEPVGAVVARGDVQLGFQQLSELKAVPGIDIVGLIPDAVQKMTLYSGGVTRTSAHPEEAAALLQYLSTPVARLAIQESGLTPVH